VSRGLPLRHTEFKHQSCKGSNGEGRGSVPTFSHYMKWFGEHPSHPKLAIAASKEGHIKSGT